jgi:serine/threonine-protein kinase
MGQVFLTKDLQLPRQVVVKVMHEHIAADPKFRERFKRETAMMCAFQHPYAVMLFDASLNDPQGPCLIMEYIRGVTLDELLTRNTRLSPVRVGRLLGQLCEVLQAANNIGIVHRDLKPSNLMVVDPDTPYEKIKVMDFGLAKMLHGQGIKKITESNMDFAVGTPGYICPELVRGEQADHRGDLYSVGIILFEMLSGRLPFSGGSTMDILLAHATEPPPFFADIGCTEWVPPAIEEVIRCCLEKDPARRPQSFRELAEQYEAALAQHQQTMDSGMPAGHFRPRFPAPAAAEAPPPPVAAPAAPVVDPQAVIHHLDAWMPQKVALWKLKGFVHDVGGEVVESVPGRIRVRLENLQGLSGIRRSLSWIGIGKPPEYEIDLRLEQNETSKGNHLHITVLLRVVGRNANDDPLLHARCDEIFVNLRAYLMGNQKGGPS